MGADDLHCDHCMKRQMTFVNDCGIFDPICVPIPENGPPTGYIQAMMGVKELNVDKIMTGCKDEEASKGPYLAQSYIIRAYINSMVIASPSNFTLECSNDMRRLHGIILDEKTPENIKFHARLCHANVNFRRLKFEDANRDLELLEKKYPNNALLYVIKSGALLQLPFSHNEFFEPLKRCCLLLPNVAELHFQKALAAPPCRRVAQLNELIKQFPNELGPRLCLAGIYAKLNLTHKAKKILTKAEQDFPNCLEELSSVYGMLKPTHSSCVEYFKRALKYNKDDPASFKGLFDYFGSTTFEYAKAIEVATKALQSFLQAFDFQEMFESRHALLKRIVRQNYWNKL